MMVTAQALAKPRRLAGVSRRHGFTLIELLTVIAIIGLLVGLSFTMLNTMRTQARRAQAGSQVTQIATAWLAYLEDHHTFPPGSSGPLTEMNAVAIDILRGNNPHERVYLDFHGETGEYLDPWGNRYQFHLDYNRDNRVPDPRGGPEDLYQSVIVWSWGPNGEDDGTPDEIIASTR